MKFEDNDIREQVEIAEKQIDAMVDSVRKYCRDNEVDPRVSMAAVLSMLAHSVAIEAGQDLAKQDACIAFILKGLYVSLAENGYRPEDFNTMDVTLPWEAN